MIREEKYPILEFDDDGTAVLNPENFTEDRFPTDKLVITFFPEVMEKLAAEGKILPERTISGENPVEIFRFADDSTLITLGQVGCPACAGNLDLFHTMGVEKVMFCGGGGALERDIGVGRLLLVDGAIRDEGFSYHYLPPSRCVYTDPDVTDAIARYLDENSIDYIRGLAWTTDAVFRETASRVARRRAEGAKIVEMEQAGCIAVARFRGFKYGALIYGGDDVSREEWDERGWRSREGLRYDLTELCRRLVNIM